MTEFLLVMSFLGTSSSDFRSSFNSYQITEETIDVAKKRVTEIILGSYRDRRYSHKLGLCFFLPKHEEKKETGRGETHFIGLGHDLTREKLENVPSPEFWEKNDGR